MTKKTSFLIVGFLLLLLGFTVAYTSYSVVLGAPGKAVLSSIWDIKFVKVDSKDNNYSISENGQEITLNPKFNKNGELKYEITIENNGNVDGLIPDDNNPIIWTIEEDSPKIEYNITNISPIKVGEKIKFTIRFKAKDIDETATEEITEKLTGKINFKRN